MIRTPNRLLLVAGLLLCGAQGPEPGQPPPGRAPQAPTPAGADEEPHEPGPRRAEAGLAGFLGRSTLRYEGQPDLPPYSLEAVYVFPERVRWRVEPREESKSSSWRSLRFQFGGGIWELPPFGERSIVHRGAEARGFRLQNELRRVAMTWPASHAWLEGDEPRSQVAQVTGLGRIEVELDEASKRPRTLTSYLERSEGPFESLEDITWRRVGERWWPRTWTLKSQGRVVWRETIDEVLVGRRYLDSFFRPADQRDAEGLASGPKAAKLEARVYLRTALEEGVRWPDALALAEEGLAKVIAELGESHELDPRPIFLLDPSARPTAYELRLRGSVPALPEGWKRAPAGDAWTAVYHGLGEVDREALAALAAKLAEGDRPGNPYARVQHDSGRVGLVQVVLPVVPPR